MSRTALTLLVCTTLLAVTSRATHSETVTFSAPASNVGTVVSGLGRALGITLEASGPVANRPLAVSVTDVPREELFARIAEVTGAEWIETAGGFRLVETEASRRAVTDRAWAAWLESVSKAREAWLEESGKADWSEAGIRAALAKRDESRQRMVDELRKTNPDLGRAGDTVQLVGSDTSVNPADGALVVAARALRAEDLAALRPGERAVWSNSPTRRQRNLPALGQSVLQTFVSTYNKVTEWTPAQRAGDEGVTFGGATEPRGRLTQTPGKVLFAVGRDLSSDTLRLALKVYDATGALVGSAETSLIVTRPSPDTQAFASSFGSRTIQPSTVTRNLAVALSDPDLRGSGGGNVYRVTMSSSPGGRPIWASSRGGSEPVALAPKALATLIDPASNDPVHALLGETLAALGEGFDVVASIPDAALTGAVGALSKPETQLSEVMAGLAGGGTDVRVEAGWVTLRPVDPEDAARNQMDRAATTAFLGAIVKGGYPRLAQTARFALSLGSEPSLRNLGVLYVRALSPAVAETLGEGELGVAGWQLLGELTKTPALAERPEGEKRMATLSPAERATVERIVFGMNNASAFVPPGRRTMSATTRRGGPSDEPLGETLADEPTEAFPAGLPAQGSITLTLEDAPDAVFLSKPGQRGGRFSTAQAAGAQQGLEAVMTPGQAPALTLFTPASMREVLLTLTLSETQQKAGQYQDGWTLQGATAGALEAMPASFQEKLKATREQFSQVRLGGIGQRTQKP